MLITWTVVSRARLSLRGDSLVKCRTWSRVYQSAVGGLPKWVLSGVGNLCIVNIAHYVYIMHHSAIDICLQTFNFGRETVNTVQYLLTLVAQDSCRVSCLY